MFIVEQIPPLTNTLVKLTNMYFIAEQKLVKK